MEQRSYTCDIPKDVADEFARDPLRVLYRIRLSAERGERLDETTLSAMRAAAPHLADMPAGQVFAELSRLLVSAFAGQAILDARDVLTVVLPELEPMAGCPQNTPYHIYDVLEHTAGVVNASPAVPLSRWAALLHDVGKPQCRRVDTAGRDHFKGHAIAGAEIARSALVRLEAPPSFSEDVCTLVFLHEWFPPESDASVEAVIARLDGRVELYRALLALQVADSRAKAPISTERGDIARRFQARLDRLQR